MPVSKAQQRAVTKYMKENYDEIKLRIPKGQKSVIQAYAEWHGVSVNRLIWTLMEEELERNSDIRDRIVEELERTVDPRFPKMKDLR